MSWTRAATRAYAQAVAIGSTLKVFLHDALVPDYWVSLLAITVAYAIIYVICWFIDKLLKEV